MCYHKYMVFDFNKYQRDRYRSRLKYAISFLGGKCIKCGTKKKLQLDHIDPKTKTREMSSMHLYSWENFIKELSKCQILCFTHHIEKTKKSYPQRTHGSCAMYNRGGCRCDLCRKVATAYSKKRRELLKSGMWYITIGRTP